MNILGTGMSGLVGARIIELLSPQWSFENLSLETGVDITNPVIVDSYLAESNAPWVLHLAAYTDVDGAEKEKEREEGAVWRINVTATEHLIAACKRRNKHALYISTDYVFDGTKEEYNEDDLPNPKGWYAQTKYEGEKRVLALGQNGLVVRIANPFRPNPIGKKDFVHRLIDTMRAGDKIKAPSDQQFVPTLIDDITYAIEALVEHSAFGIYHVVGSQVITPYKAALRIAEMYGLNSSLISETTFREYFSGRAARPFRANLKNDKIAQLGVRMKSFEEGLAFVYAQEQNKNKTL